MAHDGDAALDQEAHGRRHRDAALQLDGRRAGFLEQPGGILERLFGTRLIAAEGQVDDDDRA